jgi:AAA+ superfamily predicted ATPase
MIKTTCLAKADAIAGLSDAFARLDKLLTQAVDLAQDLFDSTQPQIFHGLQIQSEEVNRLLLQLPGKPLLWCALGESSSYDLQIKSKFSVLAERFSLSSFDIDVLIIAIAPEFDLRYERIYAFLQDDVTRRRPNVDLVLNLLCQTTEEKLINRDRFAADSPLISNRLISLSTESQQAPTTFLASSLSANYKLVQWLLGETALDARLEPFSQAVEPATNFKQLYLNESLRLAFARLTNKTKTNQAANKIYLNGRIGSGKGCIAEALAKQNGLRLLTVQMGKALAANIDFRHIYRHIALEAWFQNALIFIEDVDVLTLEEYPSQLLCLAEFIEDYDGFIVFAGKDENWNIRSGIHSVINIPISLPDAEIRQALWQKQLTESALKAEDFKLLAQRFRLAAGQIVAACETAQLQAQWQALIAPGSKLSLSEVMQAARNQSGHSLARLARKILPKYQWDDLILPDDQRLQLEEICLQFNHQHTVFSTWGMGRKLSLGRGLNILFSGPPGTGKTMAAEVIAHQLGLDLYKIDLSQIVSKYIGETEKNLDKIFTAAEDANAILFFDEADALFGKRSEVKDAHDRYANIEVGYLLQKMEEYEGIAILATNLRNHLDDAFVRRLQFIVEFPMPDEHYRKRIWETLFPAEAPVGDDVDFQLLAREIRVAGGNIKNIGLASAFYAANDGGVIRMLHLLRAAHREHQKLGRSWQGFNGAIK